LPVANEGQALLIAEAVLGVERQVAGRLDRELGKKLRSVM